MNASRFEAACVGRKVEFVFEFTLEDPPEVILIPPGVRFIPPNRFALVFRRLKPVIEHPSPKVPAAK
jgi:hypothetical protein